MNLLLTKPAICFDIESTGTDPVKDKILELGIRRLDPNNIFPEQRYLTYNFRFNPGRHIPEESTAIHGITDEDVVNEPLFEKRAEEIKLVFAGCDIIGYNSNRFDVPMLVEHMLKCGIEIFSEDTQFVDVQTIFMKKEERTLSAAVKFFLGGDHKNAHSALADVDATINVLIAEIEKYPDIGTTIGELVKFSKYGDKPIVDYAGKLVYNNEGRVCYNIGNSKGTPVEEDPGFGEWMMQRDFPLDTKRKLKKYLDIAYYGERVVNDKEEL
jgi:DNA polymerase-3 subunit epsilon